MRAELEAALTDGGRLEARVVRDLWPLGLMRARVGQPPEVLVARPVTYTEVSRLLAVAYERGLSVIPFGGGSGVCGAVSPNPGQLALDLSGLDRILHIDRENLLCRVQAGVLGMRLEEELQALGLTLGHYPSSLPSSSIGGLVSTRSSGQESTRYGSVEDMVAGLRIARPDGTILEPRPGPRSAAGPALHQLWIGAEGGLGVLLEVELRIMRRPASVIGRGYDFAGLEAGLGAMRELLQLGVRPLVLRLYDEEDTAFQGAGVNGCLLVVAVAGEPEVAAAEAAVVRRVMAGAEDAGERPWEHWLGHRFDLSAQRLRDFLVPGGAFVDTIELAATWDLLPQLHAEVKRALGAEGLALCHFSHAYPQGCCAYFSFAGSAEGEEAAEAAYSRAWQGAMEAALELGATITHHHGVGQARSPWVRRELGGWWQVWEAVRTALDSRGNLNPWALGRG